MLGEFKKGKGSGGLRGPVTFGGMVAALLLGLPWGAEAAIQRLSQKVLTADGLELEGSLALPEGARAGRKVPAVLMLAGSGTTNRYENVPASVTRDGRPALLLKPIEEALLKKGVAVFVYDKRGVRPTDKSFLRNELDDERLAQADARTLAADALAAYDKLARDPRIDSRKIAVLGHSEGAILALKIAEKRPATKVVAYMGGFHRPFRQVADFQAREMARRLFGALDRNRDGRLAQAELSTLMASGQQGARLTSLSGVSASGVTLAQWQQGFSADNERFWSSTEDVSAPWTYRLPREWYRQYAAEGSYLKRELKLCHKTVVLHGEQDAQTPFQDARELKEKCALSGKKLAGFRSFPGMGHGLTLSRPSDGMDALGPMESRTADEVASTIFSRLR